MKVSNWYFNKFILFLTLKRFLLTRIVCSLVIVVLLVSTDGSVSAFDAYISDNLMTKVDSFSRNIWPNSAD